MLEGCLLILEGMVSKTLRVTAVALKLHYNSSTNLKQTLLLPRNPLNIRKNSKHVFVAASNPHSHNSSIFVHYSKERF